MIIETSCNRFFLVREHANPALAQVWEGIEVKKTKAGYVPRAKAKWTMVRRAGTRIVAKESGTGWI